MYKMNREDSQNLSLFLRYFSDHSDPDLGSDQSSLILLEKIRKRCHSEGPWQPGEVGLREPHEVQQGQVEGPACGSWQSQTQVQAGWRVAREQPWGEGLGGTGGWEAQHEVAICICSPESQLYPGLHQEKRGQQVEGGHSAPLLSPWKATLHSSTTLITQHLLLTTNTGLLSACFEKKKKRLSHSSLTSLLVTFPVFFSSNPKNESKNKTPSQHFPLLSFPQSCYDFYFL